MTNILAWIEPNALLLALVLPPVIRVVGHFIPEELFMVAMGVLAARSGSAPEAALLLTAVGVSHFLTDQVVYLGGRWLRPRLGRFPKARGRLEAVTARLEDSPAAMAGFVPARILPLGRGAWLAGCGVAKVSWPRFAAWDITALTAHVAVWSGLGWWLAGDLVRLEATAEAGKVVGVWLVVAAITVVTVLLLLRRWSRLQPAPTRATNRIGASFRRIRR